jgi:hypothetical protein
MSRARPWVLGIVLAVLVVGTVLLVNGGRLPWNDLSPCDLPGSVATGPASDASDVQVVEQGFTQSMDGRLSAGAILQYTGKGIAFDTRVSFQAIDSAQRPVGTPTAVEVPVLLSGQRVGIGQDTQLTVGTRIAALRVLPETTHRLPAGALGSYQPVTAMRPRTSHPDPLLTGHVDIHYTDASTNCAPLVDGEAAVVYRNAHGRIVGGALDSPGSLIVYRDKHGVTVGGELHPPTSGPCQPGTRDMWITPTGEQPTNTVPMRTEIYPYCGIPSIAPTSGTTTSSS